MIDIYKRKHCMIDLETLSTNYNACIVSIGACKFTFGDGITDEFKINIDAKSAKQAGLHISPSTIEWWSKQDPAARKAWQQNSIPIKDALTQFLEWYGSRSLVTWGCGANFDITITESALKAVGMEMPWKYHDVMCYRTLKNIIGVETERSGTYHDALDDAKSQARTLLMHMTPISKDSDVAF